MNNKTIIGLIEKVRIHGPAKSVITRARIDTGAKSNSIDIGFAKKLGIEPGAKTTIVKSAMGKAVRHVVMFEIEIADKKIKGRFTLADRSFLRYPVLIGRNILGNGFLIDPGKK